MTGPAQGIGRVLVVEDDESTGLFVTRVLRRHGFRASWAVDAEQATALMSDMTFDVLLADYRLPGKSGIELAAETRRLVPEMAVAVMTSVAATGMEKAARSNGADDFFEKPLHSANFVTRITELVRLSRSGGRQSNGSPPAQSAQPAGPVVTAPGVSPGDEAPEVSNVAESGPGEQAPKRGGVLARRDTDRTSGSGGPLDGGTGGISQARCSALLKLPGQDVVRYGSETFTRTGHRT